MTTRPILCGPFPGNLGDTLTLTQPSGSPITIAAGAQALFTHPAISAEEWFANALKYVTTPPTFTDTTITYALGTASNFTQENSGSGTQIVASVLSLFASGSGAPTVMPTSPMTSNVLPSPFVASASTEYTASYKAWNAFENAVGSTYWASASSGLPATLEIDVGSVNAGVPISYFVSNNFNNNATNPATWTFQGSNDNSWSTTLDTRSGQGSATGTGTSYTLTGSTVSYRYFRLNITACSSGTEAAICEMTVTVGTTYPTGTMYYVYMNSSMAIDLTRYVGGSISSLTIANSVPSGGTLVGFISTDGGFTWYYWNGSTLGIKLCLATRTSRLTATPWPRSRPSSRSRSARCRVPGTSLAFAWGLETTINTNTPTVDRHHGGVPARPPLREGQPRRLRQLGGRGGRSSLVHAEPC